MEEIYRLIAMDIFIVFMTYLAGWSSEDTLNIAKWESDNRNNVLTITPIVIVISIVLFFIQM